MNASERPKWSWIARLYFWLAERLYHELAWVYDPVSWLVSLGHWDAARKSALDYVGSGRVLELGFGTGELLLEMRRRGLDACGLDASPQMQRVTRRKMRRSGLWAALVQGSAQRMPFASGSFDCLLATFPSGYILEPETWLEAARVLHPAPIQPSPLPLSTDLRSQPGSGGAGRLIVVGVLVLRGRKEPDNGQNLLGGQVWEQVHQRFQELASLSGLRLSLEMRRFGRVTLPILIAERLS